MLLSYKYSRVEEDEAGYIRVYDLTTPEKIVTCLYKNGICVTEIKTDKIGLYDGVFDHPARCYLYECSPVPCRRCAVRCRLGCVQQPNFEKDESGVTLSAARFSCRRFSACQRTPVFHERELGFSDVLFIFHHGAYRALNGIELHFSAFVDRINQMAR